MWLMSCQRESRQLEHFILFLIKHSRSAAPLLHAHAKQYERDPNLAGAVSCICAVVRQEESFKRQWLQTADCCTKIWGCASPLPLWFFVLAKEGDQESQRSQRRGWRQRDGCETRLERGRGGERERWMQPMRSAASWKSKRREREEEREGEGAEECKSGTGSRSPAEE